MNRPIAVVLLTLLACLDGGDLSAEDWHDDIVLPFVDDPAVVGAWRSVDIVEDKSCDYTLRHRKPDLYVFKRDDGRQEEERGEDWP